MVMEISKTYASIILKKLRDWQLIRAVKGLGKGRARGRKLAYALAEPARKILEQDLQTHAFFRNALIEMLALNASRFPTFPWKKELLEQSDD
jgi:hypothetical protein